MDTGLGIELYTVDGSALLRQISLKKEAIQLDADLFSGVSEYDRGAEWHYLNSIVLMKRGRVNDAMRELEIACTMDPSNMEYQRAKQMFNTGAQGYGSTYYGGGGGGYYRRSNADDVCDCCTKLICLDCLCECMGGNLIPCI